jgi:hypothetical protein
MATLHVASNMLMIYVPFYILIGKVFSRMFEIIKHEDSPYLYDSWINIS